MARVGLWVLTVLVALLGEGCSPPCGTPSNPCVVVVKDPPQVFLTAPETNQIGTELKLRANVVGCVKITQIQILQGKTFLYAIDNPTKVPVEISLPPSIFNNLYQSVGIAANLSLVAKGVCDDARTNTSTPVGVKFFPVASVTLPAAGNALALPDVFVAEGGVPGIPTTFVGCVTTTTGIGLARFDTLGNAINANLNLPFPCSYNSVISERNPATGYRWLLQQQVGVFSFNSLGAQQSLDIEAYAKGDYNQMAIGPDGDAIVWDSKAVGSVQNNLFRLSKSGGAAELPMWGAKATGIMAGTPVVSQNEIYLIMWAGSLGSGAGNMLVQKFNYTTGAFIGEKVMASIEYDNLSTPTIPPATFSADGLLVFFAFQNTGGAHNTSGVVACASNSAAGCNAGVNGGAKWVSPLFDEVIAAAVPFSNGSMIAAIGQKHTYFLSAVDGSVINQYMKPIAPDGDLVTMSVQPGAGTDFYLMNGPQTLSYPTEIVAVDSPAEGELWRVQISGGDAPSSAVNLAIDDNKTLWLRIGQNQVKPLTLSQYRMVKGANKP